MAHVRKRGCGGGVRLRWLGRLIRSEKRRLQARLNSSSRIYLPRRRTAWPLYRKYGHAYEAFRLAISDPDVIFNEENMPGLSPEVRKLMLEEIAKRLTPTAVKIRADIEVTCFQYATAPLARTALELRCIPRSLAGTRAHALSLCESLLTPSRNSCRYEGITAIKRALLKGMALGSADLPIKIKLVAPPLYVMLCTSLDKKLGIKLLTDAIEVMQAEIREAKGGLQVKLSPRAVDEKDDKLLSNLMSTLEAQNQEIDGDNEEEDADEGMGSASIDGV